MNVRDFINTLNKYYKIIIINGSEKFLYEDQTIVPGNVQDGIITSLDFYEDDGDGERIVIYVDGEEPLQKRYDPLDKKATDITPFDVYSPSELGLDVL